MIFSFTATLIEIYLTKFVTHDEIKTIICLGSMNCVCIYVIKTIHFVKTESNILNPLNKCVRYFHKFFNIIILNIYNSLFIFQTILFTVDTRYSIPNLQTIYSKYCSL